MRVLHVIPDLGAEYGGPAYSLPAMTRALSQAGLRIDVIATFSEPSEELLSCEGQNGDVRVMRFRRRPFFHWTFSWALTRWLFGHISGYDVVHVHALFNYPTLVSCLAARRQGVPYVVRPLGTLDPWAFSFHGWKKAPYFRLVESRNLKHAAAIHATSPLEESVVRSLGLPVRIETIPLGVNSPQPLGRQTPSAYNAVLGILCLSRLHPIKGLDTLIEAFDRIHSTRACRLVLAGDGDPRFVRRLRKRVEQRGLSDRISFPGWVSGGIKQRLLESADIFVLPSYSENFGLAVAEAMAAGIPVVVSDRVGLAPAVKKAGAGIVVPVDSLKIAEALSKLLDDPERRRRMGMAGQAYVASELSWPQIAKKLISLYDSVLKAK